MIYEFNPLNHGFDTITKFPELEYMFPMLPEKYFIKVISYNKTSYWYDSICIGIGMIGDKRIKIKSGIHNFNLPDFDTTGKSQNWSAIHTQYSGLITSDEFAKTLLIHIFGTTQNESVETIGNERYESDINQEMKDSFDGKIVFPIDISN